jgi:hypothetical protein
MIIENPLLASISLLQNFNPKNIRERWSNLMFLIIIDHNLVSECPKSPNVAHGNRVFETADTIILLAKLDLSNHKGRHVSNAVHNIPELAILGQD